MSSDKPPQGAGGCGVAVAGDDEGRRARAVLLAGEGRYCTLYEQIPLMYFTLGADGTVLMVNAYGGTYVSPAVAGAALGPLRSQAPPSTGSAFARLTVREREVLQLLAEGHSTGEIAERLHMAPKTVYFHREQMMEKLDIHSVAGLTRYAIQQGLTSIEPGQV